MNIIPVHIPAPAAHSYEVRIAPGLLSQLGTLAQSLAPSPSAAIITDSNVAPLYLQAASASLTAAGYRVIPHVLPAGERNKTLHQATLALDTLLHAKVERSTPVIALGGGVVGDLAGFVAATLLRGVPFIQCPTTLLAAVDASVGGKVGVDHPAGKNLIGAFHQPKLVLTDIAAFATLPATELQGGLAECIKHAVIKDPTLFTFIEENLARFAAYDHAALGELVARNVAIKAAIVEQDPFEKSIRALLNLGHTFGHAIESVTHYKTSHGQAVGLGMLAAANLAQSRKRFPADDYQKLRSLIHAAGLPINIDLDPAQALAAMATDKKILAGKIRLILPTHIGHAEIVRDVPDSEILAALNSLQP